MILLNKFILYGQIIRNYFLSVNYKFSPYQIIIDSETNKLKFLYYKNAYIYDGPHTIKYCLAKQFKFVMNLRMKTWVQFSTNLHYPYTNIYTNFRDDVKSFIIKYKKYYDQLKRIDPDQKIGFTYQVQV